MYTYSFEKLEVWQLAKKLVVLIYEVTRMFPAEEKYGLVSQMRRASVSICSNLAEGAGRKTQKDQSHFYTIAYGSMLELLNQCIISKDLNWINDDTYPLLRQEIDRVSVRINALRNSALTKITGQ